MPIRRITGGKVVASQTNTLSGVFSYTGSPMVGGVLTEDSNYFYHTFLSSSPVQVISNISVDALVVAGGGGAGGSLSSQGGGGGGGAGGLIYNAGFSLAAGSYFVTVGLGGTGYANSATQGGNGQNSVFSTLTAIGGGGGGAGAGGGSGTYGKSGGSGGGAGYNVYAASTVGLGTTNQGYNGGQNGYSSGAGGGGGGGSGGLGQPPTNTPLHNGGLGGVGTTININGTSVVYAAGGIGGSGVAVNGSNGAANTGNGGNAPYSSGSKGDGGSGIVIIRYSKAYALTPVTSLVVPAVDTNGWLKQSSFWYRVTERDPRTNILLHMDGNDDGTVFADSSLYNNSVTRSGSPVTKTGTKKFGTASCYFNGSSYLNLPDIGGFAGDWTWDAWVYITGGTYHAIYSASGSQGTGTFKIYREGANSNFPYFYSTSVQTTGAGRFNDNTWTHLACVRLNNVISVYVNGTFHGSCNLSGLISLGSTYVGRSGGQSEYFTGYLDELRVMNGVALWSTDFIPPTSPYL